jgi:TrmH family RNA methyltransferase
VDDPLLARVRVVLYEPQDPVNIGTVVRAMKNMGVSALHLVRPKTYDPDGIERVAHDTGDIVRRVATHETLEPALADCVTVAAFTARRRAAKRAVVDAREAAAHLSRAAADGPVALVFGREDRGLPNEVLDRAQLVVMIPTTRYASLNLAQAVLLGLYEVHLAVPDASRSLAAPRKDAPPPTDAERERACIDARRALDALDFFKARNPEHVMRTLRSLTARAGVDARELGLLRAMAIEVLRTIDRVRGGIAPS